LRVCAFEQQAALRPAALALEFDDGQLSYAELNAAPISWRIGCAGWVWERKRA